MSRKLLFVKGMLICFLCDEEFAGKPADQAPDVVGLELLDYCFKLSRCSALQLLAWALNQFASEETARTTMNAYERFLATLDDAEKRDQLASLDFGIHDDPLFEEQRQNDRLFGDALEVLFFDSHQRLSKLTRRYGVF